MPPSPLIRAVSRAEEMILSLWDTCLCISYVEDFHGRAYQRRLRKRSIGRSWRRSSQRSLRIYARASLRSFLSISTTAVDWSLSKYQTIPTSKVFFNLLCKTLNMKMTSFTIGAACLKNKIERIIIRNPQISTTNTWRNTCQPKRNKRKPTSARKTPRPQSTIIARIKNRKEPPRLSQEASGKRNLIKIN